MRRHKHKTTDVLKLPLDQREWLTSAEALEFILRDRSALTNWTAAGLLPNTIKVSPVRSLFLRSSGLTALFARDLFTRAATLTELLRSAMGISPA